MKARPLVLLKALLFAVSGFSVLSGCTTPAPPPPDFTLFLNPQSLTVQQGGQGTTNLTITPQNGFNGTVSLSLVGAPQGVSLSRTQVNVPGTGSVNQILTLSVAGNVAPGTYSLKVRAFSRNITKEADLSLTVSPLPGKDIVVFNDIDPFDNTSMANPNNQLMVRNLVNYTHPGPRGTGTKVLFDRGRNSVCGGTGECSDGELSTMRSVIQGEGFTIQELNSTQGSITSLPGDVKVIFLWNPTEAFTNGEINVLKQFANEGGRVVFIGEWQGYYNAISLENDFLGKMGAVMTNTGQAVDCGRNTLPQASLRPHQITQGMTNVTMACSSVLVPGPNDYPLYYDSTNTKVLSAVATIDVTPLPLTQDRPLQVTPQAIHPRLNPRSSTGY